jgi:hypothetical protein
MNLRHSFPIERADRDFERQILSLPFARDSGFWSIRETPVAS